VPGLDEVLGGGVPEGSFTVIAGSPGTGKTTIAAQFAFANASEESPALYFVGTAEPPHKLRAHLQYLTFFDAERDKPETRVHFVDVGPHATEREAGRAIDLIRHALASEPGGVVVVDLPQSLTPPAVWDDIAVLLASRRATSVLVAELECSPAVMALADTILRLDRRAVTVVKSRGREHLLGRHNLRISERGMCVFPRWPTPRPRGRFCGEERLSTGIEGLDHLMGGGIAAGGSVLVEGPSGVGKSILATQFMAESGHQGWPGLVVLCEERPERWIARGKRLDLELDRLIQMGLVEVMSVRGRDISFDELEYEIQRRAVGIHAQSVVIDSTLGLELVLGGVNLQDCLWRLVDSLCGTGATVWVNHAPERGELGGLFDHVLSLKRERHLELLKVSAPVWPTNNIAYDIGLHGLELVAQEEHRPTNGHIVNYRFAAKG
jgi:circadian clock protein KaiC